ncbi:MAG: hypothetical protein RMI04_01090 [Thermofilaceae archaeon]|nr:hypothetical protein [Thermofilaceae archaeon]
MSIRLVSNLESARRELLRKLIHVGLSLALFIPTLSYYGELARNIGFWGDATLATYSFFLVSVLFISTLRVRRPELKDSILRISRDARRAVLQHVKNVGPFHELVMGIEHTLDKAEQGFFTLVETVERDYEKRYGYVAAICAVASVLASYVFFGPVSTQRGIMALAIVDPLASVLTLYLPRKRTLVKHNVLSPPIAAAAYAVCLLAAGEKPDRALVLCIVSATLELVSPEDNLTLPLGVSAFHFIFERIGGFLKL